MSRNFAVGPRRILLSALALQKMSWWVCMESAVRILRCCFPSQEHQNGKAERTRIRVLPLTGALSWRRRVNRQRHTKRSKNFVAPIGDPFIALSGDKGLRRQRRRTLPRDFLRSYWSDEVSMPSANKRDDFALFCLRRLNIF